MWNKIIDFFKGKKALKYAIVFTKDKAYNSKTEKEEVFYKYYVFKACSHRPFQEFGAFDKAYVYRKMNEHAANIGAKTYNWIRVDDLQN